MKKVPFWRNPRVRYGSVSTMLLCIALAALVLLNLAMTSLEKKHGWRVDYSFNALTTQSETTLEVLEQLAYPVHIYALFEKGNEDAPLMELLDRYAAASDMVTWEQTDVSLNPGILTRFRGATSDQTVSNDSLIISCEETGRFRILSPADFVSLSLNYEEGVYEIAGLTYESKITSAIAYVTQDTIPRVLVLQGHNELDEDGTAAFAELLEANYFEVIYGSINTLDPQPGDLLALLSPTRDLSDAEMARITEFTAQGGSILFTCDYTDPVDSMPNYQALLRSYGFLPKAGIVVASSQEPDSYYDSRIYLIPTMLIGEITQDLVGGADVLLLTGARAFESPQSTDSNLIVTPILSSGTRAYLHDYTSKAASFEQQEGDEMGPFALALEARRITAEGHVSRAMVLGCSTLLTSSQVHSMTDAQEFILRTAQFLVDAAPSDLHIMAKTALRPQLSVESAGLGSLLLVMLPMAVVCAALIVLWPRRHR